MVRVVTVLAGLALAALIVAVRTGSTWAAVSVVVLAGAGMLALLRDWRAERGAEARSPARPPAGEQAGAEPATADELTPDISAHPGGPSSDARSDQL